MAAPSGARRVLEGKKGSNRVLCAAVRPPSALAPSTRASANRSSSGLSSHTRLFDTSMSKSQDEAAAMAPVASATPEDSSMRQEDKKP